MTSLKDTIRDTYEGAKDKAKDLTHKVAEVLNLAGDATKEGGQVAKEKVKNVYKSAQKKVEEVKDKMQS